MKKTITLSSDDMCNIILALNDRITDLRQHILVLGERLTPNAQKRIKVYEELISKLKQ